MHSPAAPHTVRLYPNGVGHHRLDPRTRRMLIITRLRAALLQTIGISPGTVMLELSRRAIIGIDYLSGRNRGRDVTPVTPAKVGRCYDGINGTTISYRSRA